MRVTVGNLGAGTLAVDAVRLVLIDPETRNPSAMADRLQVIDLRGNPLGDRAHDFVFDELDERVNDELEGREQHRRADVAHERVARQRSTHGEQRAGHGGSSK